MTAVGASRSPVGSTRPGPVAPAVALDRRDARTRPDAASFDVACAALAARLASAGVPAPEFQTLVRGMVRVQLHWGRRRWRRQPAPGRRGSAHQRGVCPAGTVDSGHVDSATSPARDDGPRR